ncbi:hypothetical protein L7F22_064422 [Adiantum nelumboides]|nr:hypothetical protein [Adiantum nelumboides]
MHLAKARGYKSELKQHLAVSETSLDVSLKFQRRSGVKRRSRVSSVLGSRVKQLIVRLGHARTWVGALSRLWIFYARLLLVNLVAQIGQNFGDPRLSSKSRDRASSIVASSTHEELISDNFSSQLALVPSFRVLCIFDLFDAIAFCFAFEGKVLCKYGTYKIAKASYACHLKAVLIYREFKTLTFVVNEVFVNEFVECFDVGDYVRIESEC